MVQCGTGAELDMDDCRLVQNAGSIGADTIGTGIIRASRVTMTGGSGGIGFYQASATGKIMTRDCKAAAGFTNTAGGALNGDMTIAYATTMTPDVYLVETVHIVPTDGVGFTIGAPTSPTLGQRLTLDVLNSSGGAMGVITWNGAFLLAGAFTNPANGKRRTIEFKYDGTNWIEQNRAAADI